MGVAAGPARAIEPLESLVRKVMEQAWPKGQAPAASGFYVTPGGMVLTNAHAVAGCRRIAAGPRGQAAPATLIALDATADTALVRTSRSAPAALPIAEDRPRSSGRVQIMGLEYRAGSAAATEIAGAAAGIEPAGKVELQKLSGLDRSLPDGSSGAPVVNGAGTVLAMVVGRFNGEGNRAVATPGSRLRRFLQANGVSPVEATLVGLPPATVHAAVAEVRCQ